MKIIECGQDSWMLGELVKQLMDDAKASGVYCEESYIGRRVSRLCLGESYTKATESTNTALTEASWMRSHNGMTVYADYSVTSRMLTFSRCPF